MHRPAVHFIAFRGEEYHSSVRIFGKPDFVHQRWDARAKQEILPGDLAVFARGTDQDPVAAFSFNDSETH